MGKRPADIAQWLRTGQHAADIASAVRDWGMFKKYAASLKRSVCPPLTEARLKRHRKIPVQ